MLEKELVKLRKGNKRGKQFFVKVLGQDEEGLYLLGVVLVCLGLVVEVLEGENNVLIVLGCRFGELEKFCNDLLNNYQ